MDERDERLSERLNLSLMDQWPIFGYEADHVYFENVVRIKGEKIRGDRGHIRIDGNVKLEGGLGIYFGRFVHIASFCHINIGGGITIFEEGSAAASGAKTISGSNVYGPGRSCSAIAPDAVSKRSFVHIKKNAILFANATVLPGVTVGENSVLAVGAVATKDIPPFQLWAGVPARFVKEIK